MPHLPSHLPAPALPGWITKQLPDRIRRYTVSLPDGKKMHVMETGEGRPVLLLHGNPTWGFLYRKVAAALAGEPVRCIMPDLIGFGFSDHPTNLAEHTLANHGRWLGQLIDILDLNDLIFVGQDWGGPIGLLALADRPQLLAGLVILNTVIAPPKEGFKPTAFHKFARLPLISEFAFRLVGFPQINLAMAQGDKHSIRGAVSRAYRYPLRNRWRNGAPLATARMVPDSLTHPSIAPLQRVGDLIANYRGPAAIVWGKRDPVLGKLLARTRRALPQAAVTQTEAGHFLQEEVPGEIAQAVAEVAAQCGAKNA